MSKTKINHGIREILYFYPSLGMYEKMGDVQKLLQTIKHPRHNCLKSCAALQWVQILSHSSLLRTFGFLRPLPKIHTSHQYFEDLH